MIFRYQFLLPFFLVLFQISYASIEKKLDQLHTILIDLKENKLKILHEKLVTLKNQSTQEPFYFPDVIEESSSKPSKKDAYERLTKTKFFSWISWKDGHVLGGMRRPQDNQDIKDLDALNVGLLVTLTENPLPTSLFKDTSVNNIHIPVEDFNPPTLQQVNQFIKAVENTHKQNKHVVVHCAGGKGRTGTMLACWLVKKENMLSHEAIKKIRALRPGSIETEDQENLIHTFYVTNKAGVTFIDNCIGIAYELKDQEQFMALEKLQEKKIAGLVLTLARDKLPIPLAQSLSVKKSSAPTIQEIVKFFDQAIEMYRTYKKLIIHGDKDDTTISVLTAFWLMITQQKNHLEVIGQLKSLGLNDLLPKQVTFIKNFFSKQKNRIDELYKKYLNFSWIYEYEQKFLGGMRLPRHPREIKFLEKFDIGLVISLTEFSLPDEFFENTSIKNIHISIKDGQPPTIQQLGEFIRAISKQHDEGKNVVVHCFAGKGRTGTMLALWLIAKANMTAKEAIKKIKDLRPGSIETEEQREFIEEFYQQKLQHSLKSKMKAMKK